ncbi:MAG: carboxypeptidase Q [Sphingobacteriales bacterium]|jgi:carboxypeptidase Q
MKIIILFISLISYTLLSFSQDSLVISKIFNTSLSNDAAYENLRVLCKEIGPRLSGSAAAEEAVIYTKKLMENIGLDSVWLQPVMVPKWERGKKEYAAYTNPSSKSTEEIPILALGGSIATPRGGIKAQLVIFNSLKELENATNQEVEGKIVLLNGEMEKTVVSTFDAYGKAVGQRYHGPGIAAEKGAKALIIRSLSHKLDNIPHTGTLNTSDTIKQIPAGAIPTLWADKLASLYEDNNKLIFEIRFDCKWFEDVESFNVVGEIKGSLFPNEIVLVGGHLDSWDVGEGAHDDGGPCMQAIDVARTFKTLKIKPKRTLRIVLFMNEENGLRGGLKYAELSKLNGEIHIAAIESDAGVFTPKGFSYVANELAAKKIYNWRSLFYPYGISEFGNGYGGADIGPLKDQGTTLIGFRPDSQRYFDYHHAASDVFEAVNKREMQLGSASITTLAFLLTSYGL